MKEKFFRVFLTLNFILLTILCFSQNAFAQTRLFGVSASDIVELNPANGSIIRRIRAPAPVGSTAADPNGLAFDGTNLFWTNAFTTDRIFVLNPFGVIVRSFPVPAGAQIDGLAFLRTTDGLTRLYALNGAGAEDIIYVLDPLNGAVLNRFPAPPGAGGLGGDGRLFMGDFSNGQVHEFGLISLIPISTFNVGQQGIFPAGVAFDGTDLFLSNRDDERIFVIDPSKGSLRRFFLSQAGPLDALAASAAAAPPAQPDLTVTISGPPNASAGQPIGSLISVSVTNKGTAPAASFFVDIVISADTIIDSTDRLLIGGRESVASLSPGQTLKVPVAASASIPPDIPPGSMSLGAIVDSQKTVPESDETNNTASVFIRVTTAPVTTTTVPPTTTTTTVSPLPVCSDSNDFSDNTLNGWVVATTMGSVSVVNGEVLFTGPSTGITEAAIQKSLPLSGNFVVNADFTQLGANGAEWRHGIELRIDENNRVLVHDADAPKIWRISKVVNGVITDFLFADVANTAGLENTRTTLKIKKVGTQYTFSIKQPFVASEITLGAFNIPDFTSFSSVRLRAWAHNTPVNAKVDNFKLWTDTTAPNCVVGPAPTTTTAVPPPTTTVFPTTTTVPAAREFVLLDLSPVFNNPRPPIINPPSGKVTLGGVPFNVTNQIYQLFDNSITVISNVPNPQTVHLLIFTFNTFLRDVQVGAKVGTVMLSFASGASVVTDLVVGSNVREWRHAGDCGATINTITVPAVQEVFRGEAPNACSGVGTGPAVIDMLTITVPVVSQSDVLTRITVTDTFLGNPGISGWAMTVAKGTVAPPPTTTTSPPTTTTTAPAAQIVAAIQPDTIKIGETAKILAISSDPGDVGNFKFISSNPNIAAVDATGVVTGLAEGTAIIEVQGGKSGASTTVTVTVVAIPVTTTIVPPSIQATITSDTINVGGTAQILAISSVPTDVLSFTSDKPAVATVDSRGVVRGVAPGTATITIKGTSGAVATIKVTVSAPPRVTTTVPPTTTTPFPFFPTTTTSVPAEEIIIPVVPPPPAAIAPTIVQAGFEFTRLTLSAASGGKLTFGVTVIADEEEMQKGLKVEAFFTTRGPFGEPILNSLGILKKVQKNLYELEISGLPPGAVPVGEIPLPGVIIEVRDSKGRLDKWPIVVIGGEGTGLPAGLVIVPKIDLTKVTPVPPVPIIFQGGFGLSHLLLSPASGGTFTLQATIFGGRGVLNVQVFFETVDVFGKKVPSKLGDLKDEDGDGVYEFRLPIPPGILNIGEVPIPGLRVTATDGTAQTDAWPNLVIWR